MNVAAKEISQDGYKELKVSKLTQENATKIEKSCTFSNGGETGKICLIKAEYKHSQETVKPPLLVPTEIRHFPYTSSHTA